MNNCLFYLEWDRHVLREQAKDYRDTRPIFDRDTYVSRWKNARNLLIKSAEIRGMRRESGYKLGLSTLPA